MKILRNKYVYKIGIALLISLLFKFLFFRLDEFLEFDIIFITIIVLIIWEGNLQIDKQLNKKYIWLKKPRKRFFIQLLTSTLFTSIVLFIFMFTLHQIKFGDGCLFNRKMMETFTPALFFTFALLAVYIGSQFFKAWKQSLIDVEKFKAESANAQLQSLKNQISPHFLFNYLSVLTSLVYKSQDKAVEFINELSKVYRYVLDNNNAELVTLQEEMDFLKHYIYLLKIRFDNSISFDIKIDENKKQEYVLPMCLQMLVENTIQHNVASQANPLMVSIYTYNNSLIVENQIQPRRNLNESSKTGLTNLISRYSFFTDDKIEIVNNYQIFKVILPLIYIK
jgi:two-component system, LytTR family, sensor kinase